MDKPHDFPSHYVLTKTHCAHCIECAPSDYLISTEQFQQQCLTECVKAKQLGTRVYDHYPLSVVGKFVHLLRNPFDNIVSRFHCHVNGLIKNKGYDPDFFPSNSTGFRAYCKYEDGLFLREERATWGGTLVNMAKDVPCHADFFRYIMWHNHAFEMNRVHYEDIPTFILHYDDYRDRFHERVSELLEFLEMPWVQPSVEFYWSNYSEYYTDEERRAIVRFVKQIASKDTWRELERYGFK